MKPIHLAFECTALWFGLFMCAGWLLLATGRHVRGIARAVLPARALDLASRIASRAVGVAWLTVADFTAAVVDYRLFVVSWLLLPVAVGAACTRVLVADIRRARASRRRRARIIDGYQIGTSAPTRRALSLAEAARLAGAR